MDTNVRVQEPQNFGSKIGSGKLVDRLVANGWSIEKTIKDQILHNHTSLSKGEYEELDEAVVRVHKQKSIMLEDMRAAGLVQRLGGLGTLMTQYESISDMSDAGVNMDGETAVEEDSTEYNLNSAPVPIISKPFRINRRRLEGGRRKGADLDTTSAQTASEKVTEKVDEMFFQSTFQFGGKAINGLVDVVSENGTHSGDWDGTPGNILDDVNDLISDLFTNGFTGPYNLYIDPSYYYIFWGADAEGTGDMGSIADRITDHPLINKVDFSAGLPSKHAVLVQMSSDVIEWKQAEGLRTIDWESGSGFMTYFMVFLAGVPVIKKDQNGNYGTTYIADITS